MKEIIRMYGDIKMRVFLHKIIEEIAKMDPLITAMVFSLFISKVDTYSKGIIINEMTMNVGKETGKEFEIVLERILDAFNQRSEP